MIGSKPTQFFPPNYPYFSEFKKNCPPLPNHTLETQGHLKYPAPLTTPWKNDIPKASLTAQ